jgi:hypothetical protein
MTFTSKKHNRRSVRLRGYDYSLPGYYFVTICTQARIPRFGTVVNEGVRLKEPGRIVAESWPDIGCHFPNAWPEEFIAGSPRPNNQATSHIAKPTLGQIVAYFKYTSTKRANEMLKTPGRKTWQRSYYEHVIRDEESATKIRHYILTNPSTWTSDRENPDRIGEDTFDKWLVSFDK